MSVACSVEFGGGLELLFNKVKKYAVTVPVTGGESGSIVPVGPSVVPAPKSSAGCGGGGCGSCGPAVISGSSASDCDVEKKVPTSVNAPVTVGKLICWVRDNMLTERPELFVIGDSLYAVCLHAHDFLVTLW
jgi:hypothetical protein